MTNAEQEYFAKHRERQHTAIPDSLLDPKVVCDVIAKVLAIGPGFSRSVTE
jgi:hypothetical protein